MAVSNTSETRTFEADVAKLLHLMVHSVYSDKDIFLRELISNGADACERPFLGKGEGAADIAGDESCGGHLNSRWV